MRLCGQERTKTRLNSHEFQQLIVIIDFLVNPAFGTIEIFKAVPENIWFRFFYAQI